MGFSRSAGLQEPIFVQKVDFPDVISQRTRYEICIFFGVDEDKYFPVRGFLFDGSQSIHSAEGQPSVAFQDDKLFKLRTL